MQHMKGSTYFQVQMQVPPVECIDNADGSVSLKFNSSLNLNKLNDSLSMDIAQGISVDYNVKLSSLGFDPTKLTHLKS